MKKTIKKIKLARLGKGYSQDYMGTQLGISQRAYCKLECGKTKLTISRLRIIAELLELNPKKLM